MYVVARSHTDVESHKRGAKVRALEHLIFIMKVLNDKPDFCPELLSNIRPSIKVTGKETNVRVCRKKMS